MTKDEYVRMLMSFLPPGVVKRLGPDRKKFHVAIAEFLYEALQAPVNILQRETDPGRANVLLGSWQAALDLATTKTATSGNLARKQEQLVAGLRAASGSLSIADLRALLGPYLDYADPAQIAIIEPDRAALKTAHTYQTVTSMPIPIPNAYPPGILFWSVSDAGPVSEAGAQVEISVTGNLSDLTFTLYGPGGVNQQCYFDRGELGNTVVTNQSFVLYAPISKKRLEQQTIAGETKGRWSLVCFSQGAPGVLHGAELFVEAHGRASDGQEGLGKSLFEFAVVADAALMGGNADVESARDALQRNKPAWLGASIVNKPSGGIVVAIPDLPDTIPDESIPG